MKLWQGLVLAIMLTVGFSPVAKADSLGEVIVDSIADELRDGVRDSVRRSICPPGQRLNERGVCDVLEDVDQVRDDLRRGRNAIRAIDAIF
jgi:hypothetical protein